MMSMNVVLKYLQQEWICNFYWIQSLPLLNATAVHFHNERKYVKMEPFSLSTFTDP